MSDGQNTEKNTEGLMPPWKPGQSGNPGGRPKKLAISEPLRETLEKAIPGAMMASLKQPVRDLLIELFGSRPTFGEMIALKMIQSSARGDMFATNSVLDHAEGKVSQTNKLVGDEDSPINFILTRAGKKEQP